MSAHQDQARATDHEEHLIFKTNRHTMFNGQSSSQSQSLSVATPTDRGPLSTPVGKYHPALPMDTKSNAGPSLLFPFALDYVQSQYQNPLFGNIILNDPMQHIFDPQVQDQPLRAFMTKVSHCSKFKKFLEDSVRLASDSLTSLELFVDGIKSVLDMTLC
jgi:hypothetical protein